MFIKLSDGRVKDVAVKDVTAENYICPDKEKHLYHVVIEVRKFNSETGERLSVPRVQKFGKKIFETLIRKELQKQGYTLTILHTPENKPDIAAKAKEAARLAAEQKQSEIDEAVAKALADQEAKHKAELEEAVAKALASKKSGRKSNAEKAAEAEQAAANAEQAANEAADGTIEGEGA